MKQVIVTITKNAEVQVETRGFAGPECLTETAGLEAALGGATSTVPTTEMHQTQAAVNRAKA